MNVWGYVIAVILIVLVILLVCRELVCWYWKINERRDILQSINDKMGSKTQDKSDDILKALRSISSQLSEISQNIKNNKVVLANGSSSAPAHSETQKTTSAVPVSEKNDDDDFIITNHLGRVFAMKSGKYYCPKCHAPVTSDVSSMCSNCGKSFTE